MYPAVPRVLPFRVILVALEQHGIEPLAARVGPAVARDHPERETVQMHGMGERRVVAQREHLCPAALEGQQRRHVDPVRGDPVERPDLAEPGEFASTRGMNASAAGSLLKRLVNWRVAIPEGRERKV